MTIHNFFSERKRQNKKCFVILLDPDKLEIDGIPQFLERCNTNCVDVIFVGGSLMIDPQFDLKIKTIKEKAADMPVVIFPGGLNQISKHADAMLFLSLISGRNADYLIGNQVIAAPIIKRLKLEAIPTAYMLIESGEPTSVEFMSGTMPIPRSKPEIGLAHALAAELLGFKMIYLEAGSGAKKSVPEAMIKKVHSHTSVPLIVGGGIKSPDEAHLKVQAGADIVVVGNHFEEHNDSNLINEFNKAIHST